MSYPKQVSVLTRLEKVARSSMRKHEDLGVRKLQELWDLTKKNLRAAILMNYHQDFPQGRWDRVKAIRLGTLHRIERAIDGQMHIFTAAVLEHTKRWLKVTKREEALRAAWILDQTTPPNIIVKIPDSVRLREAMVSTVVGKAAEVAWHERWASWAQAYQTSLWHNIGLGALNASSPQDAAAEVEASRAGSPSMNIGDVMERLFRTEVIGAEAEAREEVSDANDEVVLTEIWQTIEDARVCEICDPLDGLEREQVEAEAEESIPAHPYCRCYWRVVPKAWADMADEDLKSILDAKRLVPDAMIIRDPETNQPAGAVIVDFEEWRAGQRTAIGPMEAQR